MSLIALATAASLLAPLPPGRGGRELAPLQFVSTPPGATASARYRDAKGQEVAASCLTPCTLGIPRGAPFVVEVDRDGAPLAKSRVQWVGGILRPFRLEPSRVVALLP